MIAYLLINAALYILLGLWCSFKPQETARSIGFELTNLQGIAEYTAVYGGLEIGVGVFFLFCGLRDTLHLPGILFAVCLYGGLVGLRSFSMVRNGPQIGNGWYFFALELGLLLWSVYLYNRS